MTMPLEQVENLRIMARLVREYNHAEISRTLREAADTIEKLLDLNGELCAEINELNKELKDGK